VSRYREEERDERNEYRADVYYEAWRRGYDPERAVECADDCRMNGRYPSECVDGYAAEVRRERNRREEAQEEEAYMLEMQRIHYEQQQQEEQQEPPQEEPQP